MAKKVFALDVSVAATGWAYGVIGQKPISGVIRFAPKHSLDDDVWLAAVKWMNDQMGTLDPDVTAIEAAIQTTRFDDETGRPQTNPHTQGVLWGLQAVLRMVVRARKASPAKLVNVSSARKFFTGKGSYPKGEAKNVVRARCIELGWVEPDERSTDKCDALCIWAKAAADSDPSFAANFTLLGTTARVAPQPVEF